MTTAAIAGTSITRAQDDDGWERVPLPGIRPGQTVKMRVAHIVNPRIGRFDDAQIEIALATAVAESRRQFGINLELSRPETGKIAGLFGRMDASWPDELAPSILNFKNGTDAIRADDRTALTQSLVKTFEFNPASIDAVIGFALPYLVSPPQAHGAEPLANALVETMLARLDRWRGLMAPDGMPVIDHFPYNEWVWWDSLGYTGLPWDVVITNQPVISAETYGTDVHTALRGGIMTGSTSHNIGSSLGAWVWLSSFPFRRSDPELDTLRGGRAYSPDEAAELAGAYLVHEIGHLLFHLGHPFDQPSCVMAPALLLKFAEWRAGIDPVDCPLGSDPTMVPGAAVLAYKPALIQE